jgi:TRAP-type uncharacterized transport system substrate-binding protein
MRWGFRPTRFVLQTIVLILVVGGGAWAYWYFNFPTWLKVAAAPPGSAEASQIAAYARALEKSEKDIRLKVVPFADVRSSAEAMQRRAVDLALVRPDILHPSNGRTLAILREEVLIVLAPQPKAEAKPPVRTPEAKPPRANPRSAERSDNKSEAKDDKGADAPKDPNAIDEAGDLFGKRLGVVVRDESDTAVLRAIFESLGFPAQAITLVPLRLDELVAATVPKISALAFLATPRSADATKIFEAATKMFEGSDLDLVTFSELAAVTERFPALNEATIPQGALRLNPPLPSEEVKSPSVSYRLLAADHVDRVTASKVTQYLFEMRPFIAQTDPSIHLMKAPDNETIMTAALPNHRGAADYFNREQQTFMDRYSDLLWLTVFALGGLSSLAAWLVQLFARRRREVVDHVLDRLLCVLGEARAAKSARDLDDLSVEIDGLVTHAVRHVRHRATNTRTMGALTVALNAAHAAINDRRREIAEEAPRRPARRVS